MSKANIALIFITLVQLAVVASLYFKVDALARDTEPEVGVGHSSSLYVSPKDASIEPQTNHAAAYVTSDQIRQIIQEELRTELKQLRPLQQRTESDRVSPQYSAAEVQQQKEHVSRQIEYYASVGHISDREMQTLQSDIAKLDDHGREEMLKQLVRALNSGALEGRL